MSHPKLGPICCAFSLVLFSLASAGAVQADETVTPGSQGRGFVPRPVAGWGVLELRGGVQAVADSGNAMICAEVGVWKHIALEACGSGAGFLARDQFPTEMVHFRVEGTIPLWAQGHAQLMLQPGIGIAEIERGADEPGFRFGPAQSEDQREGAGVEGSLGLKTRLWPHERFYVSGELNGGAAHVPSAPTVLEQDSPWVPFINVTVGVGF